MPTRKTPPPSPPNDLDETGFEVVEDDVNPDYGEEYSAAVLQHPSGGGTIIPMQKGEMEVSSEPSIKITATFSRTRQVSQFEPARAEVSIEQTLPGVLTPEEVVDIVRSQFQQLKSEVLSELGCAFDQDEATGRIMEAFPGATVVASRPVESPYDDGEPAAPPQRLAAAPPRRAAAPVQSGARRPAGNRSAPQQGNRRPAASNDGPSNDDLWTELMEFPHLWNDMRGLKQNDRQPDFQSTEHMNDRGYGRGLWLGPKAPAEAELPTEGFANYE